MLEILKTYILIQDAQPFIKTIELINATLTGNEQQESHTKVHNKLNSLAHLTGGSRGSKDACRSGDPFFYWFYMVRGPGMYGYIRLR